MKGNASVIAMTLVSAIILISIGMWVVSDVITATGTYRETYYVSNETNTSAIGTGTSYVLATASGYNYDLAESGIVITNSTGTWTTTNYTAYTNGTVIFGTVDTSQLDTAYFTYSYGATPSAVYTANNSAQTTTWNAFLLLSVVTIVIAAVFVMGYFGVGLGKK